MLFTEEKKVFLFILLPLQQKKKGENEDCTYIITVYIRSRVSNVYVSGLVRAICGDNYGVPMLN